jgi:predicted phosphodiesterase
MRIAVMTDAHANLPALEAALRAIRAAGCDAIFHTGDAVAIGPFPAETLDLLLGSNVGSLMGNHDSWFARGIPDPRPAYVTEDEYAHQVWTHSMLDSALREIVARWPDVIEREFEGTTVRFLHYALDEATQRFKNVEREPSPAALDALFAPGRARLVCYGHDHRSADIRGLARYVNPGALGCFDKPLARYCIVDFSHGGYTVNHHAAEYDDAPLAKAFTDRDVPARELISKMFFGGRF